MILRKAKLDDFEVFKELYEDEKGIYQWIYIGPLINHTPKTSIFKYEFFFDDSAFDCYKNYTIERFQSDLNSSTLIYIIEEDGKIIGYISLFHCLQGKYKIAEWAMLNPDDESKKIEALNCLKKLKLPRLRKYSICTFSANVVKFLLENGFTSVCSSFYELEI